MIIMLMMEKQEYILSTYMKIGDPFLINHEATILKKLYNPNVIRVRKYKKDRYMLLDYMDLDLETYISKVPVMPILIDSYMKQLLNGLQYCHSKDILHLDIKPFSPLALQEDFVIR